MIQLTLGDGERRALAAIDSGALLADVQALVRVPSVTGDERAAAELVCAQAQRLGLDATLEEEDLSALRAHPGHPGEERARTELVNARVSTGSRRHGRPRLALCAHIDVVAPGTVAWADGDPFSGARRDGRVFGRGSADMKAGVAAALHALAAVRAADLPVCADLLAVSSEEDGGLGAFAALLRDADYDACVVTEPTGFDVVCAQAGSITFTGTVTGVAAHAAHRLRGASAIDRYVDVHAALAAYEREVNADVADPLMAALELPYPVNIGRLAAGDWPSSVPDRLVFEGRAPVRVGETVAAARAGVERAVASADPDGAVHLAWTGGSFASARTADADPLVGAMRAAARDELGREVPTAGVPWGADMRLFTARGIPTVMCGTRGIEVSHAVDEHVAEQDVVDLARLLTRWLAPQAATA